MLLYRVNTPFRPITGHIDKNVVPASSILHSYFLDIFQYFDWYHHLKFAGKSKNKDDKPLLKASSDTTDYLYITEYKDTKEYPYKTEEVQLCVISCVAFEYFMERGHLYFCHEWTDRTFYRKSAG